MVTAAASCCFSTACVNFQVARESPNTSGTKPGSLPWDPLHRSAMLRSNSYLSASTSLVFTRRVAGTGRVDNRRMKLSRASLKDESDQLPLAEIENGGSNSVEVSETAKNFFSNLLSSVAKPAVVAVMMALLLAQPSGDALAANSGGRMGGKSFSKPAAPSRSYSGGGGGGRSYSGGGYAPPIYASPYGFSPFGYSPFYGGGYGGGLFFGPSIGFGGGGTILLAMIAFATVRAVLGFIRDRFSGRDDDDFDE